MKNATLGKFLPISVPSQVLCQLAHVAGELRATLASKSGDHIPAGYDVGGPLFPYDTSPSDVTGQL